MGKLETEVLTGTGSNGHDSAPVNSQLFLVDTPHNGLVKHIAPREAFRYVKSAKKLPSFEPVTIVGGAGSIKTMVGYGIVKRIREAGIPISGYILASGSTFMGLEEIVEDKDMLHKFVLSIPDLIDLRRLPRGERLVINRLREESKRRAEFVAYTYMSTDALPIKTQSGTVVVNRGIYDTQRLDEKLQDLLQKATGKRPKLSDIPKAQIIAHIFGRGSAVLNEEFPDMYLDEAISGAIRIPQYFPPKILERDGKVYIIMDAMGSGYFPLRKDLLQGAKGHVLALLYGHHKEEEIADPAQINLSGLAGYFVNQRVREETIVTEFVQLHSKWTTGKSTRELAKDNGQVYLIAPDLNIPPYTIKVPQETILQLINVGVNEADAFLARCRMPAWWLPYSYKNGHAPTFSMGGIGSLVQSLGKRAYDGLRSAAPPPNMIS
ncbi:hypothetical protein HYX05_05255 [Candidatus Woesearchaeota archaeon]|nr:hypothetical protein [Candidatus Woesearchaeota archaeon]